MNMAKEEGLKKLYEDLSGILDLYSGWLYDNLIRNIGWGIIQVLAWINDWIEGVATAVVSLGGLYDSQAMQELIDVIQPLTLALFVVSITVLGFMFMLNKVEKRNEIVMNILVAVSVILVVPSLMSTMDDLLNVGLDELDNPGKLSDNVLKRNIADVKYYVDSGFNYASGLNEETMAGNENLLPHPPHPASKEIGTTNYTYGNELEKPSTISINEKLDIYEDDGWFPWSTEPWVKDLSPTSKKFLKNRLISTGDGGTRIIPLRENAVPATNLGQQAYYRYHVNWGIVIATLSVTAFALVITVIKIGRAIFDLAYQQLHVMFTAATDLTGGQRIKKVLTEMANTVAVIFIMMVLLHLFTAYAQWVNDLERNIGIVGVIVMLIAGAWALIDAPDIIQRTMGVDAGLRSGWQAMMGGYAAGKMVGAGGKVTGDAGGKVLKAGGKTVGGTAAGAVGLSKGIKNRQNVKPMPSFKDAAPTQRRGEGQFSTSIDSDNTITPSTPLRTGQNHQPAVPTKPANQSDTPKKSSESANIPFMSKASGGNGGDDIPPSSSQQSSSPKVGSGEKAGHVYPKANHTLLGGNKTVQRAGRFMTRAHNTGYDVGEKIGSMRGNMNKTKHTKIPPKEKGLRTDEIRDSERD